MNNCNGSDCMTLPQGMAYGWWHFDEQWLETLEFQIEIMSGDERSPGRYFQLYQGHVGEYGMYMGFQTDLYRPGMGGQGKGLIFSRWGTRSSADACPPDGGWAENSGHEGDFVGVRAPFNWQLGRYECWLGPIRTDHVGTWYELRVHCLETGENASPGSLRFPNLEGARPLIASVGSSWTEVYGDSTIRRESIPLTELTVRVTANDGALLPTHCDTNYSDNFPDADCFISPNGTLHLHSGHSAVRSHPSQRNVLPHR